MILSALGVCRATAFRSPWFLWTNQQWFLLKILCTWSVSFAAFKSLSFIFDSLVVMCLSLYLWVYPSWSLLTFLDILLSIISSNVSSVGASSRMLFVEYSFFTIVYGLQFSVSLYIQFKRKNKSMRHCGNSGNQVLPPVQGLLSDFTEFSAQLN